MSNLIKKIRYLSTNSRMPEKPIVIQFPIIDICNSRCKMCNIWENKKSEYISIQQILKGLNDPLYSEVVSVGVNGGEPTLRKDLPELVEALFDSLPKLQSISLITNGYNYKDIIKLIQKLLVIVDLKGGTLHVMLSLDGFNETHDIVRGKKNGFYKAEKVLDYLLSNLDVENIQVGCTVIEDNIYGLRDIFEYCYSKSVYIKYRLGIPHQRLYTKNQIHPYKLSFEQNYHFAEFLQGLIKFYEKNELQRFFYQSLYGQIVLDQDRIAGCDWKHRGVTISSKGQLAFCAVESKDIGSIYNNSSYKLYHKNIDHLKDITENKCRDCNHDYKGVPNKEFLSKIYLLKLLKKLKVYNSIKAIKNNKFVFNITTKYKFKHMIKFYRDISFSSNNDKVLSRNNKNILICGWYGTETLGDKAILAGLILIIRKVLPEANIILSSLNPYVSQMTVNQMYELDGVKIINVEEAVKLSWNMDYVVFGGGPLMDLLELAPMQVIFENAKKGEAKTIIAGCGIGPLYENCYIASTKKIIEISDRVLLRDEESYKYATNYLGLEPSSIDFNVDPAFIWLKTIKTKLDKSVINIHKSKRILSLGLRDFPYQSYAKHISSSSKKNEINIDYRNKVILILEKLIELYDDLLIRPIPMCTNHFGGDDRWFYYDLFRESPIILKHLDTSFINEELNPLDYCKAIYESKAVLAMRFHSLVFSLGLNVPVVALDYTLKKGKVSILAKSRNVPCFSLDEIDVPEIVSSLSCFLTSDGDNESSLSEKLEYESFYHLFQ